MEVIIIYKLINDQLYYIGSENKKYYLCNFLPIVCNAIKPNTSNLLHDIEVELKLVINDITIINEIIMPLSKIKTLDWESLDYRCQLGTGLNVSVIKTHIYKIIRKQLSIKNIIKEVPFYERTGWVTFNSERAYIAGNNLITSSGIAMRTMYKVPKELDELSLEIDKTLSIYDTAKYIVNLFKLSPGVSDVLVANLITGLLRSLFVEAGITPRFTCYLVGPPQSKKTSIACLINNIYNRTTAKEFALINLLSSSSAVHKSINFLQDCCYIVDDLFKSENKHDMRIREERLSEVIRTIGNNAAKVTVRGKELDNIPPNCNVVSTAEYLLQGYSTLSRCIIIHVNKPIPNDLLYESQKNPKALSTFIFHFIKWICGNFDKLILFIRDEHNMYLQKRSIRSSEFERQLEAQFILNTAINILLQYFLDNKIYKEDFTYLIKKIFKKHCKELILIQIEDMKRSVISKDENQFSKYIAYLYSNNMLDLEKKKKKMDKSSNGIICKGNLCLSPGYVLQLSKKYFNDYSITINKITTELRKNGLLDIDASNRSTKKLEGIRLLQIRLIILESFVEDNQLNMHYHPLHKD